MLISDPVENALAVLVEETRGANEIAATEVPSRSSRYSFLERRW